MNVTYCPEAKRSGSYSSKLKRRYSENWWIARYKQSAPTEPMCDSEEVHEIAQGQIIGLLGHSWGSVVLVHGRSDTEPMFTTAYPHLHLQLSTASNAESVASLDACLNVVPTEATKPCASETTTPLYTKDFAKYDQKMRAEAASPVALLVGGLAGIAGFAIAGILAAVLVGFVAFVGTVVVVERSLQRTMQ